MASVYCALDRATGDLVALKLLAPSTELDARFELEAATLADVRHPGIVRYVAHGRTAGQRYLAMEWLEGEDLAQRLHRQGLAVTETLVLGRRVADALAVLHGSGLVHRDVKPANLFLAGKRVEDVKLLDFGVIHADRSRRITRTGDMIGTPAYMAPEQARGDAEMTPAADVFALGCVLWECLVGRPLFAARNVLAVMARVVFAEVASVRELRPELAPSLDRLLAAMLAKDPTRRLPSGAEVATALARLDLDASTGGPPAAPPPSGLTASERRLVSIVLAQPSQAKQREVAARLTVAARPGGLAKDKAAVGPHDLTSVAEASTEPLRVLWAAAERYGARIEPLLDGSVAAMLVATGWASDLAVRAARCSLAMREALPDATMALATCHAVLGNRLPLGDVIDGAAALLRHERKPEGGRLHVRIDEMTAGFLDGRFDIAGDDEGLALRGERAAPAEGRLLLGKVTPCVGRERELATLDALFDECVGEPLARAALVTGPAGIGKSRLRHELVRQARDAAMPVEIWIAHGDAMSAGAPFGLLGQALRAAAGLRDGEPAIVRAAKLRARVSRHVPPEQRGRVAELLGELLGIPPVDAAARERAARRDAVVAGDQMRRAFEDFVRHEARAQPVLLVLEDLQWGDLPSIRLADAALRAAHDLPFFVLAVGRPDVHDLFPSLFSERGLQELRLGEISKRAAERLAREVLPAATSDVVARIVEQAGGNPLYLEELLRAVSEGRDELPATVLAMMQTRLEALPAEARRLLRAGSIFGRVFWRSGAAALLGDPPAGELEDDLELLVERELVRRRAQSRFRGEAELVFRHATVRDAAYAMLTEADRILGHRLAAGWLERMGDADALGLAEHHERGGELARAIPLYRRSAEQALEGNDLDAAVARAERGVACGAAGEELGALRLIQAEAYGWASDGERSGARAEEARRLLPAGTDGWFRATAEQAAAARVRGERELLVAVGDELIGTPGAAGPRRIALAKTAAEAFALGEEALAERLLAAVGSEELHDALIGGHVHLARALRAQRAGDPVAAMSSAEQSAQCFVSVGDLRFACLDWTLVGAMLAELGQLVDAEAILRDMLADAERMRWSRVAGAAKLGLAQTLVRAGRWDEALAIAESAAAGFAARGDARSEAQARRIRARALLGLGRLADAEAESRELLPEARATLAAVLAARGDEAAARIESEAAWLAREAADDPAWIALVCARLLRGRVAEIARAELEARAARIVDPALRRSFREGVPERAALLALA